MENPDRPFADELKDELDRATRMLLAAPKQNEHSTGDYSDEVSDAQLAVIREVTGEDARRDTRTIVDGPGW